jgi:hypothetical protein
MALGTAIKNGSAATIHRQILRISHGGDFVAFDLAPRTP